MASNPCKTTRESYNTDDDDQEDCLPPVMLHVYDCWAINEESTDEGAVNQCISSMKSIVYV